HPGLAPDPGRRGPAAPGGYSMTTTTSPEPTDWPASTLTSLTVPVLSAVMLFSIFIASRTHTVWPSSTLSPSLTSTFTIVPCIGTATWPLPAAAADAPEDRRGRGRTAGPPAGAAAAACEDRK